MDFVSRCVGWLLIFCSLPSVAGVVYIDKVIQESNPTVVKMTLTYTHDAAGNSVTNVTFETLVTISKVMIYLTARIADDKNNSGVYRDLVKTVVDVEKLYQGSQANPIVKSYSANITRSMNFTLKFPMPPGIYKVLNVIIDAPLFLQLMPHVQGSVDLRGVGKYGGSKKMRYLAHLAISGGFRR